MDFVSNIPGYSQAFTSSDRDGGNTVKTGDNTGKYLGHALHGVVNAIYTGTFT